MLKVMSRKLAGCRPNCHIPGNGEGLGRDAIEHGIAGSRGVADGERADRGVGVHEEDAPVPSNRDGVSRP